MTDSISALGIPQSITLHGEDEHIVRRVLEKNSVCTVPGTIVTLQPKVTVRGQVVFSKYSKRVKKRNSFTVAFTDPQDPAQHKYGQVVKFLTYPADMPNCLHIAVIEQLKVESCRELLNMTYPPEIQCLKPVLCTDYVSLLGQESGNSCGAHPVQVF